MLIKAKIILLLIMISMLIKKTFTNFPNESEYSEPKNYFFDSSNNLNNTPNFNNSSYLDNPSNNKSNNN